MDMTDDDYELYKRFEQCTEIYHCTPLELDNQDSFELEAQWILHNKKREIMDEKEAKSKGINRTNANKSNTFGV